MKKLSLILALILIAGILVGCTTTTPSESGETISPETPGDVTATPGTDNTAPSEGQTYGNTSSNIQSGGFVVEGGGYLFYALNGALYSRELDSGSEPNKLYSGAQSSGSNRYLGYTSTIRCLNYWDGRLYFVADTGKTELYSGSGLGEDYTYERVYSVLPDGSGLKEETAEKPTGGCTFDSGENGAADVSFKAGYLNAQIVNGYMYYITSAVDVVPLTYHVSSGVEGDTDQTVTYTTPMQLRRIKLGQTGEVNEEVLVEDMGNLPGYFCADGETLYYVQKFLNPFFAPYDFVNIYRMPLDGGVSDLILGGDASTADVLYRCDRSNVTMYIAGIQVSGGKLYISRRESQGDFTDSWLDSMDISVAKDTSPIVMPKELLTECGMVRAIIDGAGVYYTNCTRENDNKVATAEITYLTLDAEGGHNTPSKVTDIAVAADTYMLNADMNVCAGDVFYRTWEYEGGETLFSCKGDGSDRTDY